MFTVIYRTGGTENAEWHKALPVATEAEAQDLVKMCARGGWKALIHKTAELERIGMPEGWEA